MIKEKYYLQENEKVMGVYRFGAWLSRSFPEAISKSLNVQADSFLVDMNGLVHKARNYANGDDLEMTESAREEIKKKSREEKEYLLFYKLFSDLDALILSINPQKAFVVTIDGVTPYAKQAQSEARRMKAALEFNPAEQNHIHSAELTPGTELMFKLDSRIRLWFSTNLQKLPPKSIYMPHTYPGEGEHNIARLLRTPDFVAMKGAHVFHGNDSDIVMIALVSPSERIIIARERERATEYVYVDLVKKGLIQTCTKPDIIHDFGILIGLTGDDFRPNTPSVDLSSQKDIPTTPFEEVFNAYRAYKNPLTRIDTTDSARRVIDWQNLREFFGRLTSIENKLLNIMAGRVLPDPLVPLDASKVMKQSLRTTEVEIDLETFRVEWRKWALLPRKAPKGYISTISEQDISEWVTRYLESIEWVFGYYRGYPVSKTWVFPYRYSPTIADIYAVMMKTTFSGFNVYSEDSISDLPITQLIKVTPLQLLSFVPEPFRTGILSAKSGLHDFFYSSFDIDYGGKGKKYEGIPLVPIRDPSRIIPALQSLGATQEHFARYALTGEVYYQGLKEASPQQRRNQDTGFPRGRGRFDGHVSNNRGSITERGRGRGGFNRGRGRGRDENEPRRGGHASSSLADI